jgi:hypothetical protein
MSVGIGRQNIIILFWIQGGCTVSFPGIPYREPGIWILIGPSFAVHGRRKIHHQVVLPVLIQRNVGTIYFMFGVRFRGLPIGLEDGLLSTSVDFFIK